MQHYIFTAQLSFGTEDGFKQNASGSNLYTAYYILKLRNNALVYKKVSGSSSGYVNIQV